jgi:hypothetical protein
MDLVWLLVVASSSITGALRFILTATEKAAADLRAFLG